MATTDTEQKADAAAAPAVIAPQPVDQRTGQAVAPGSMPRIAELNEQRKAKDAHEREQRSRLSRLIEDELGPRVTSGQGIVDQRKLGDLVEAEVKRIAESPEGIEGGLASLEARRAARVVPNRRGRHREAEAAREKAAGILAEVQARSAWLFADILAKSATEWRLQELVDELQALESQHHLGIDLGGYVRLPGKCVEVAGQRLQILGRYALDGRLPQLESCPKLPEEFQRPQTEATPTDQRDHGVRAVAGAAQLARNSDGTITGGHVPEPRGGQRTVIIPRTEREEREAHEKIAAELYEAPAGAGVVADA